MKTKRLEPPRDAMPNLTAMVDLVMCILIFFMLGSHFVRQDAFLPSNFETIGLNAGIPTPDVTVDVVVTIRPDESGAFAEFLVRGVARRFGVNQLRSMQAELKAMRATLGEHCRVVLKPDRDVAYRPLAKFFDVIRDAGFDKINFAVKPDGRA